MACQTSLVAEGRMEKEFSTSGAGADAMQAWSSRIEKMLRKKLGGLCERGCKERFTIKRRVTPVWTGGGVQRVLMQIEFRVTCE